MRLHRSTTLALALAATIAASGCGLIGGDDEDPAGEATEATQATDASDAADPTVAATTAPVISAEPTEAPASTPADAAEPGSIVAPDGFQVVTSRESTFTMAVPEDWTDVTNGVTEQMLADELDGSAIDENLQGMMANPDTFDLMAIDLAATGAFASNVNVIDGGPTPAGGTAESLVANLVASETADFFDEILADYEATTIEGRPAVTVTYLATPVDTQLKGQQVYLLDDNYYVVTYSASPDQFRDGLAAQMAASIS